MSQEDRIVEEALGNLRRITKRPRRHGDEIMVMHHDVKLLLECYDLMMVAGLGPGAIMHRQPAESAGVTVSVPLHIAPEMIEAVKSDPLTSIEDKDEWHKRLGWLVCAYDVMIGARRAMRSAV